MNHFDAHTDLRFSHVVKSGDYLIMETLQSRPGGVYRDERIKALYAPAEFEKVDFGDVPIMASLAAIAEELTLRSLYVMQAITLIAAIIAVVVLSNADGWMVFAAAGLAIAFLAVVASAGAYLIGVKTDATGARS